MGKIVEPEFDPAMFDIRHTFDAYLDAKASVFEPTKAAKGFRASSLGYCLRRQFLERAGVPKPGATGSRTLFLGDIIHGGVQRAFTNMGLMLGEETAFEDEALQITGHVDMIWGGKIQPHQLDEGGNSPQWIRFNDFVRELLVAKFGTDTFPIVGAELKSAHQYSAEKAMREGPQFHHQMQAGMYDWFAENHPEQLPVGVEKVEKWQIVMIAKSDLKMPVFDVSPTMKRQAFERITELREYWEDKAMPACTCGVTISWEQKYCPYAYGNGCCDDSLIEDAPDSFWEEVDAVDA